MFSHVAGDVSRKRLRPMPHIEECSTTTTHPFKRQKHVAFASSDTSTSTESFTSYLSPESKELHHQALTPRLVSFRINPNSTHPSKPISTTPKAGKLKTALKTTPSDHALLRNILAYDHTTRRPTFNHLRTAQDQLIADILQIGRMVWRLICEYSNICHDLSARFDAVNAIQSYLTRNINNIILLNIASATPYETKCIALETLIQITFNTLSNDSTVIGINGLLHARVGDFLGEAMVKVVVELSEGDLGKLVQERRLCAKMKELQRLIATLRWPIEGVERCVEAFQGYSKRQGRLSRYSFKIFQMGVC